MRRVSTARNLGHFLSDDRFNGGDSATSLARIDLAMARAASMWRRLGLDEQGSIGSGAGNGWLINLTSALHWVSLAVWLSIWSLAEVGIWAAA